MNLILRAFLLVLLSMPIAYDVIASAEENEGKNSKQKDELRLPEINKEGWTLCRSPIFTVNSQGPANSSEKYFNSKEIHQRLKNAVTYIMSPESGYQLQYQKQEDDTQKTALRNIVLGNIEIIIQNNGKYYSIDSAFLGNKSKQSIFQSGFGPPHENNEYDVISGYYDSVGPISVIIDSLNILYANTSSIIDPQLFQACVNDLSQAALLNQQAATQESKEIKKTLMHDLYTVFGSFYGHSEQFLIYNLLNKEILLNNIHKIINKNKKQSLKGGQIVSIILHIHSYYDVCQKCSITLSKTAEELALKQGGDDTKLYHILNKTKLPNEVTLSKEVQLNIMVSSQAELLGRREYMQRLRSLPEYKAPVEILSPFTRVTQIDPAPGLAGAH